jgi:hypothetical protein
MLTENRLARNKALIRSLNQRVAVISETLDTFGSLKFMCECGIYACRKRIELTASEYQHIRPKPTHFVVHPDHVLHALEFVVLEYSDGHAVVEQRVTAAASAALATEARTASEKPLGSVRLIRSSPT